MPTQNYIRYKRKHFKIGGFVPDELTSTDLNDAEEIETIDEIIETEEDKKKEDEILGSTTYEGDSNITTDKTNIITDLGTIHDYDDFDKSEYTNNISSSETKICEIKDKNTFDQFTEKYGIIKNKNLLIDWPTVKKHFKGIFIGSSIGNRLEDATYKNVVMTSWVQNEYKYIDDVIIFSKDEKPQYDYKIKEPFRAHIVDYYGIENNKFVSINDDITNDKILVINSIKHFDQFTQKYGKTGKRIDWSKVKTDYIGFFIGDDKDLKKNRYAKCFFNDKLVTSWWSYEGLNDSLVYMFE